MHEEEYILAYVKEEDEAAGDNKKIKQWGKSKEYKKWENGDWSPLSHRFRSLYLGIRIFNIVFNICIYTIGAWKVKIVEWNLHLFLQHSNEVG